MATLPIFVTHIQASRRCLGPHEKRVKGYPDTPKTLGEHLRKRRLDLHQTQEQAALHFGISVTAYIYWEASRIVPKINKWPAIVRFLGFNPSPSPTNFGQAVTAHRRSLGLDKLHFARRIGVDAKSVHHWESGRTKPAKKLHAKLAKLGLKGF